MNRSKSIGLVAACLLLAFSIGPALADECGNPDAQTLCSAACGTVEACKGCCEEQYEDKTDSSWAFIKWVKRVIYQTEYNGCRKNCELDMTFTVTDPSTGNPLANYTLEHYGAPENGWVYGIDFPTLPDLTIIVSDPVNGVGRVKFIDPSDNWVAYVIQESAPQLQVETASGAATLVYDTTSIDSSARSGFENAIAPLGSTFRQQLTKVVVLGNFGARGFEGFAPVLRDLLGMGPLS